VEISNRYAALESLDGSFDINSAWESIRENMKTSAKENLRYRRLKHNKPWFHLVLRSEIVWSYTSTSTIRFHGMVLS
jgi:hypothetical protein